MKKNDLLVNFLILFSEGTEGITQF